MDVIACKTKRTAPPRLCAWRAPDGGGFHVRAPVAAVLRALGDDARAVNDLVVLILDYSGSMSSYKQRLNETAAAIATAALESGTADRLIGVVFGSSAAALNADELALLRGTDVSNLTRLGDRTVNVGSSTSYRAALNAAINAVQRRDPDLRARVTALFMTDGQPDDNTHIQVARTLIRTHPAFELQPVLFTQQEKASQHTQRLLQTLYDLHLAAHTEQISFEDFALHRVRLVTTGSDGLTQALQAARGLLARPVFMTAAGDGARARLVLGAHDREAVGFLPDAPVTIDEHGDSVLRIRLARAADTATDSSTDACIDVPIVAEPAETAETDHGGDALLQLRAALAGEVDLQPDARARLAARARSFLAARAENDDGARVLLQQLADFERDAAREAAAAPARTYALASSSLQTRAPDSLLQLLDSVGAMAALGGARNRTSAARGATSRLNRLAAAALGGTEHSTALGVIERDVRARLATATGDAYPAYLDEDLQMAEIDRVNGDALFVLMDAPGCELQHLARQPETNDEQLTKRVAIALNHGDCARASVAGFLTHASLVADVEHGLDPLHRRMIVLFPTDDADTLRALAPITAGALMIGELLPLPPQGCDALIAAASRLLDFNHLLTAKPLQLSADAHLCSLFLALQPESITHFQRDALCPLAASRASVAAAPTGSVVMRSLRTALMHLALGVQNMSLLALLAELIRKRVAAIARLPDAHVLIARATDDLLRAVGVSDAAEQTGRALMLGAGESVDAARAALRAIKTRAPGTLAFLPDIMSGADMLTWLSAFIGAGDESGAQDPYAWPECPSWRTFSNAHHAAWVLRAVLQPIILQPPCVRNGFLTQQGVDEMRAAGRRAAESIAREEMRLTPADARALFDIALQTLQQQDQKTMQRLEGLPARAPTAPFADDVPLAVQLVLLKASGDADARVPGGAFDVVLARAVARVGELYSLHELRPFVTSELALDEAALTRRALIEHCELTAEQLQLEFAVSATATRDRMPVHPDSRLFHRRLNWLCRRIGLLEPRAYSGAEALERAQAVGVSDSNLWWLARGVALVLNHDTSPGAPRLRISHLGGVDRDTGHATLVEFHRTIE